MKIKPVTSYTPPAYPTYEESRQDTRLLERLPKRWQKNSSIASLIGTGFLVQAACVARGNEGTPATDANVEIVAPQNPNPEQQDAGQVARAVPATRVAPILESALANDGRGSFGCIAVSAPVFLSENEALDLIQAELEKAGLKLHDWVTLDGLAVPALKQSEEEPMGVQEAMDWEERAKLRVKTLENGSYAFDFGTADKSVVVKFLARHDFDQWKADDGWYSSVTSFNFSWLATEVRKAFVQRDEGEPVVIGLFFEPSTYPLDYDDFDLNGLTGGQKQLARRQMDNEDTEARAREKLRAQVLHFVEYLRQEGVVE